MQNHAASPIRLRPTQPNDAAAIADLVQELQREVGVATAFDETQLHSRLTSPDSGLLLAVAGGVVAGLLGYNVCQGLLHGGASFRIEELMVGGPFRRRGIGRALLTEAERLAKSLGCVELEVTTLEDNLPAQALYRSAGFAGGAILMEKDLLDSGNEA